MHDNVISIWNPEESVRIAQAPIVVARLSKVAVDQQEAQVVFPEL